MKVFGVDLHWPHERHSMLIPLCAGVGLAIGALIHSITHGTTAPVYGMGAAGFVGAALAFGGADLDAGWRGVAVSFVGSCIAFAVGTALAS